MVCPYVYHPFHLAEKMEIEETIIVALLHDVIEDTDYTIEDIVAIGFPKSITDAFVLITHDLVVNFLVKTLANFVPL